MSNYKDVRKSMGMHLRHIRTLMGGTQKELAEAVGVTQYAVSQYENGKLSLGKFAQVMNHMDYDVVIILKNKNKNDDRPKEIQISI